MKSDRNFETSNKLPATRKYAAVKNRLFEALIVFLIFILFVFVFSALANVVWKGIAGLAASIASPEIQFAIRLSLFTSFTSTVICVVFVIPAAYGLERFNFPGRRFVQELKNIHQQIKTTTIHITHNFNEALVLADRMGVMCNGEIVQVGSPEEVFQKPRSQFVAEFVAMENIYSGDLRDEGGVKYVHIGPLKIRVMSNLKGKVRAAIRPEDIIIAGEKMSSSAQNMIPARIAEIIPRGPFFKVVLNAGIPLVALVTRQALDEMILEPGKEVWTIFKTTAVHVF